jgi:protein PhnA
MASPFLFVLFLQKPNPKLNMRLLQTLTERSNSTCELCTSTESLKQYTIPPSLNESVDNSVLICDTCLNQIEGNSEMDANHWRCLNDSMWSEHVAVQIMAWRMLQRLRNEGWPKDLLDMMYLDDEALALARATGEHEDAANKIIHRDVNGVILEAGDSVVLIKDLKVKGSSMVAKQGTAVRNIRLDHENIEYIEGKVDGQHIVIITKYVKKI